MVAIMYEEEWYRGQEQQWPLGKAATRYCYLAAVANCSLYVSLISNVNARLGVSAHSNAGQQRVSGVAGKNVSGGPIGKIDDIARS
jgi:hypothetical protein